MRMAFTSWVRPLPSVALNGPDSWISVSVVMKRAYTKRAERGRARTLGRTRARGQDISTPARTDPPSPRAGIRRRCALESADDARWNQRPTRRFSPNIFRPMGLKIVFFKALKPPNGTLDWTQRMLKRRSANLSLNF